jgi:hypothetical protein
MFRKNCLVKHVEGKIEEGIEVTVDKEEGVSS